MVVGSYLTIFEKMYRKAGNWIAHKIFLKTPLTGNFVTFLSFLFALASAICFAFGTYILSIVALVLFELSIILDYSDGEVARAKGQAGIYGDFIDRTSDLFKDSIVLFGIGYGLFMQTNQYLMLTLGFGCVIVYLTRQAIAHIIGFCYKGTQKKLRNVYKKQKKYKIIRLFQALFIPFFVIAVFFKWLYFYLWSYMVFYALYDIARTLYSLKFYR